MDFLKLFDFGIILTYELYDLESWFLCLAIEVAECIKCLYLAYVRTCVCYYVRAPVRPSVRMLLRTCACAFVHACARDPVQTRLRFL